MILAETDVIVARRQANKATLLNLYGRLKARFGYRHWWPGETPIEVIVGAILTQNTAWVNVEKAIANLKTAGMLDVEAILTASPDRLAELIRPSGYYNQKAARLQTISRWFKDHESDPAKFDSFTTETLRAELLALNGVGPETADSILLYALNRAIFVIDAYTRRIMSRLGFAEEEVSYTDLQELFHRHLSHELDLFNDFHAQFVALGKDFCKPKPRCSNCPLSEGCISFRNSIF